MTTVTIKPGYDALLYDIIERVNQTARRLSADDAQLRGLWRLDHICRPIETERQLRFSILVAQARHQGCCYADLHGFEMADWANTYLGKDLRELPEDEESTLRIAAADTLAAALIGPPDWSLTLEGTPDSKARDRAVVLVDLAERLAGRSGPLHVGLIGVMGAFVAEFVQRGHFLSATDYSPELIAHGINGVPVLSGDHSPEVAESADVVVVCGEALASGTLGEILDRARNAGKPVLIYAVTGAYLAEIYCREYGVSAVLSEPQPQYLFQGPTRFGIYLAR